MSLGTLPLGHAVARLGIYLTLDVKSGRSRVLQSRGKESG